MRAKYSTLDIFKLDIIARELKKLDTQLETVRREAEDLQVDARKMPFEHQAVANGSAQRQLDCCSELHGHLRDVIHQCLSEMQRMHIGVALDDHEAAGKLEDGGKLRGKVEDTGQEA